MPWCQGRGWQPWLETDDELLAEWLAHRELFVKAALCGSCVATIAGANTHHPVRAYLAGLEWDGVPRLSLWLTTYLGAYDAPPEYVHAVGRAWLISLVARAMRPGCQVDHLLILEGPQGARKSSALRALVPDPAWFTDNISALGTKDSAQDLRGKWLIELSDLSAMKRTEVERIKAAISHPVDHYRPSYGRYSRDFPRQCVFAGTTNEHAYLFDSTGNRRFWCLKIGRIDLAGLAAVRGQLWAEARHAFDAGEKWHLEPAVELLAATEQAKRREEEPFTGPVLDWVAQTTAAEFHIVDIMRGIGIADTSKHTKAEAMRIAAILRDAGYASRHTKHGKAWRKVTPAEVSPEVSPGVVITYD
jgi:putative DNA primase/helicase